MKRLLFSLTLLLAVFALASPPAYAGYETFDVLHTFQGGQNDGHRPGAGVSTDGSKFYGTAAYGGTTDDGVIYSINTDGTGYTILHNFVGYPTDGEKPNTAPVVDGNKLYGVTLNGGAHFNGVVYSINKDGSGYTVLHNFDNTIDGKAPRSLTLINDTLYGVTTFGGASDQGTVFSIDTDGTDFTVVYELSGNEGIYPQSLMADNGVLYGNTLGTNVSGSPDSRVGSLFSVNPDGSNFTVLHEFDVSSEKTPRGDLLMHNGTIYGTASEGGQYDLGVVYSIDADGTDYTVLHSFEDTLTGAVPHTGLTYYAFEDRLVGTAHGGTQNGGLVYSMLLDGSDYTVERNFERNTGGGSNPTGVHIVLNDVLYGVTSFGGGLPYGQGGLLYSMTVDNDAPVFSNIQVDATRRSLSFTWDTDELASTQFEWGETPAYGNITEETDTDPRVLQHSAYLDRLRKCTEIFYRLIGTDAYGNTAVSEGYSAVTDGCR